MHIGKWLKGPLKPWLLDTLNYSKIKEDGFIDPYYVETLVNNHFNGRQDNSSKIWNILMWQTWLENWY